MGASRSGRSFPGTLAASAGATAAAFAVLWLVRFGPSGSAAMLLLPADPMEIDRLTSGIVLSMLLFTLVPFLSLVAMAAGTASIRERIGQVGFALGFAAFAVFAVAFGRVWLF